MLRRRTDGNLGTDRKLRYPLRACLAGLGTRPECFHNQLKTKKVERDWHHHSRAICLRWFAEVHRHSKKRHCFNVL